MQSFLHISLSAPPVQCQYLQLHKRLLNRPERCSAVASAGANCDTVLPAAATGPSRRFLLQTAFAAPLLLRVACPVAAALAAARVPRPLTPDEAVAVAAALAVTVPPIKAPVMLRLPFHDAGTYSTSGACGGANASVQYELDRPENFGLNRGW